MRHLSLINMLVGFLRFLKYSEATESTNILSNKPDQVKKLLKFYLRNFQSEIIENKQNEKLLFVLHTFTMHPYEFIFFSFILNYFPAPFSSQ